MPFSVSHDQSVGIISIKGKFLGAKEGEAFKEAVNSLRDSGTKYAVLDLSGADLMDSTGIGLTIRTLSTLQAAGGDVVIAALNARIKNLFLMTRLLGTVFKDYETVDEAVASFGVTSS
ncbi:MAG: STAS domain-containing protein [Rhodothermales bacterium]|nr:STAS domain-containing protein [Rhodothermales bacterium]